MEVDFSGDFLTWKMCQDGEIAEVTGEGAEGELEFRGVKKKVYNIPVKYLGKDMMWTPNNASGSVMVERFGADTKLWVGRKFQTFRVDDTMKIKPMV